MLCVVMLITQPMSSQQTLDCPDVHQSARKKLGFLRRDFMFVEKPSSLLTTLEIPKRVSRDVTIPGNTNCPWRWTLDDNPDRVPRFLTKAVCSFCGRYCRAVLFHHRGLVQKCDVKTGETVWKWVQVKLPVAFVYDSKSWTKTIHNRPLSMASLLFTVTRCIRIIVLFQMPCPLTLFLLIVD